MAANLIAQPQNKTYISLKRKHFEDLAARLSKASQCNSKVSSPYDRGRYTFILIGDSSSKGNEVSLNTQLEGMKPGPNLQISTIQQRFQWVPSIRRLIVGLNTAFSRPPIFVDPDHLDVGFKHDMDPSDRGNERKR